MFWLYVFGGGNALFGAYGIAFANPEAGVSQFALGAVVTVLTACYHMIRMDPNDEEDRW